MPLVTRENALKKKQNLKRNEQPYRRKKSMFECKTPDQNEIASEIVKADCINHGYRLVRTLGEGAYAKVKLANVMASKVARNELMSEIAEETGDLQVAVKVIAQRLVPKEFLRKFLPRELDNHANLPHHQHVVRIFETYTTDEHVYIVMDYCSKGDLLDLINKHIGENQKGIGEALTRKIFNQLCQALRHIHNNGIVHRDLKCENVLLDENMDVKLTDFGFSCYVQDRSSLLKTTCGSYAYTAPEVIKSKAYDGFRSDIWSLGIILFAMANGRLPFNDAQLTEMDEEMKMQRLRFERTITFDCMILIRKLLQYHPTNRPNISDILEDPWITGKKPIPRQINKPKWINPYDKKVESPDQTNRSKTEGSVELGFQSSPARTNIVAYHETTKTAMDNRTGTVLLNQEAGETVTLKSRVPVRKNIRTIGPNPGNKQPPRPNTWPRASPRSGNMTPMSTRTYTRTPSSVKNVDVNHLYRVTKADLKGQQKQGDSHTEGSNGQAKSVPMWILQQIMESEKSKRSEEDLIGDSSKTTEKNKETTKVVIPTEVDTRSPTPSPAPLSSCPACNCSATTHHASPTPQQNKPKVPESKPPDNRNKNVPLARSGTQSARAPSTQTSPARRPIRKFSYNGPLAKRNQSKSQRGSAHKPVSSSGTPIKKTDVKLTGPNMSKSYELAKQHRTKTSASPAIRAQSCRERKLNLYNIRVRHEQWPLPPLLVQSLHPCEFEQKTSCYSLHRRCPSPVTPRNVSKHKKVGNVHSVVPKHKIIVHCH